MNNQMSIFDLLEKQKPVVFISARRNDPETSHEAASRVDFRDKHFSMILQALETPGGKDMISERSGLTGVQVARRLKEMVTLEMIRETKRKVLSASGRNEREFERI